MRNRMSRPMRAGAIAAFAALLLAPVHSASAVWVGDTAPLFQTLDENMQPVDMANLIADRPLVIIVGSAS